MRRRIKIPPPVPAPYLRGLRPLPDDVLAVLEGRRKAPLAERRRAVLRWRQMLAAIRARRERYERRRGVVILPEPPHDGGLRPGEKAFYEILAAMMARS